jgi:hypothetical protein
MSKEERIYFENELLARLKSLEWPGLTLTAVKKGLKFRLGKELVAQLDFQYLVKAQAYTLLGRVFGGPIFECCSKIVPPYRSNLGSDAFRLQRLGGRIKGSAQTFMEPSVPQKLRRLGRCVRIFGQHLKTTIFPWLQDAYYLVSAPLRMCWHLLQTTHTPHCSFDVRSLSSQKLSARRNSKKSCQIKRL